MEVSTQFGHWLRREDDQGTVHWRGTLYDQFDQPIDPLALVALDVTGLAKTLRSGSGFFAFIIERRETIIAGVDAIRSIPLFFHAGDCISDSAEWIRARQPDVAMDPEARLEFQLAGYVTGNRTLWAGLEQIGAGKIAVFQRTKTELHRYIEFDHATASPRSQAELTAELDDVLDGIFRRLITYAGGRQIVVPLSGGYDSRLVVTMLKRAGYENVLCFSYGVAGNAESVVSKQVADSLGYRWTFAEYTDDAWRSDWSSSEAAGYRAFASGHCALPHIQDWLAVARLVRSGALQKDCVVVPGHAGDFIAGSHITRLLLHPLNRRKEKIVNHVIDTHFSNAPPPSGADLRGIRRRIAAVLGDDCGNAEGVASAYDKWVWKERQSKYIANALRVYDYFGLDWWMPLWDMAFIHYWNSVPLDYRFERQLGIAYMRRKYADVAGIPHDGALMEMTRGKTGLRYTIKILVPRRLSLFVSALLRRMRLETTVKRMEDHPLSFASLVPRDQLRGLLRGGYNIIGIYSKLFLEDGWGNVRERHARTNAEPLGGKNCVNAQEVQHSR